MVITGHQTKSCFATMCLSKSDSSSNPFCSRMKAYKKPVTGKRITYSNRIEFINLTDYCFASVNIWNTIRQIKYPNRALMGVLQHLSTSK